MLLFGQGSEKYEFASWWFGMKKTMDWFRGKSIGNHGFPII